MQIKAISKTAGGKAIWFVLLKVVFTGYGQHSCYNKADSDVVCHLFSISRRLRLAHLARGKLTCSVLLFLQIWNYIRTSDIPDLCFIHSDPATKAVTHLKSQCHSNSVKSRQSQSFTGIFNCSSKSLTFIWGSGEDEEGEEKAVCKTELRGGRQKHFLLCSH